MANEPLLIWAVSDGRAGIEAQALGLAQAVARLRPAKVEIRHVAWTNGAGRLPWWLNLAPRRRLDPASNIAPPWPDLWIAAGRATLPLSMRLRRWSRGRTFVVQLQDPRAPLAFFDLVIPPRHDRLSGANVFAICGSPHRATRQRMDADLAAFADAIAPLPHPRVAVMIGGKSRAFDLPPRRASALAHEIGEAIAAAGGSLMLSFSRRTPDDARALLSARLRDLPGLIWEGQGANPYFAFLAAADHILVTEDSTNMAAEAASTGKPVHILDLPGDSLKFARFHAELAERGVARRFRGELDDWTYAPLAETERAAAEVLRRWDARAAKTR